MIHEVGNIELCGLLDTESKTQCKVCLSYWDIGIVYCTYGHFLRKGREENQKFNKYTMDLLSILDYYTLKGRPHGHRYGEKPGDKEYNIANQLKKWCKKRCFQGIHDRFVRDEQFRSRMIQIDRPEDLCRQMDDLADEDHTHHLNPQEYYNYQSNWWLRSNKTGSDTVPVQRRPDFKQALSTLQQLKEKEDAAQRNQRWAQSSSSWCPFWWCFCNPLFLVVLCTLPFWWLFWHLSLPFWWCFLPSLPPFMWCFLLAFPLFVVFFPLPSSFLLCFFPLPSSLLLCFSSPFHPFCGFFCPIPSFLL